MGRFGWAKEGRLFEPESGHSSFACDAGDLGPGPRMLGRRAPRRPSGIASRRGSRPSIVSRQPGAMGGCCKPVGGCPDDKE